MESSRKFKIIVDSKECGTCSGLTPSAVAKKVVKKLCGSSSKVVKFSLKECKRGCERVCGPYEGRMEKLDRPCKRGGKTITHRVVCGKVRKMRGGRDLRVEDFRVNNELINFRVNNLLFYVKFDEIGLRPHIFLGPINLDEGLYYEYAIFNNEHFGGNTKTCGFSKLQIYDGIPKIVSITGELFVNEGTNTGNQRIRDRNIMLIKSLISLLVSYKYRNDYKTIKKELKKLVTPKNQTTNNLQEYPTICEFSCNSKGERYMLWTKYYRSYITDYFSSIISELKEYKVNNITDLFKKKTDDIQSYTHKKSMFSSLTCYYSLYLLKNNESLILFSKNENNEYYYLAFIYNEDVYIAIYDSDNKIVSCYLADRRKAIIEYYPTDFSDIFRHFVTCLIGLSRTNKEIIIKFLRLLGIMN